MAKRDRLARDPVTAALVERLAERDGARIESADGAGNASGPEGALMRAMIDAFAAYERAMIRARTKSALATKARRGERVGQVPFGYAVGEDGRTLTKLPAEQQAIARIDDLRASGATLSAITEQLNAEAVPARGKRWHLTSVARIVSRVSNPQAV